MLHDTIGSTSSWDEELSFTRSGGRNSKRNQTKSRKFPPSQKQNLQDLASQNSMSHSAGSFLSLRDSGKKGSRDRSRKKQHKHKSSMDNNESSDESECLSPRSRSGSIVSTIFSPTKLSAEQIAVALLTSSPNTSQFQNNLGGVYRHHRTPSFGASATVEVGLRHLNPHQLQHSPYYRALFGSPASGSFRGLEGSSSEHLVLERDRLLDNTSITADGLSEESPLEQKLGLSSVGGAFRAMNLFGDDADMPAALSLTSVGSPPTRVGIDSYANGELSHEHLTSISNEESWPALPQKMQRQVSRGISFAPSPLLRSPGRLGSNRKTGGPPSSSKLLHCPNESKKWMRSSDKYLDRLLLVTGSAKKAGLSNSKQHRDSTTSPTQSIPNQVDAPLSFISSPRRLRFPEPGAGTPASSSLHKVMPAPLFAASPGESDFRLNNGFSFSPIQMSPLSSLTPDRHKIMSAYGGNINGNREFSPEVLRLVSEAPSAATPFKQSLTPGVLSSPSPALSTHHHHISFARYLAMTTGVATPSAVSRSTKIDELQLLADDDLDNNNSNLLVQSCYSELDPQRVVRVLHEAFLLAPVTKGGMSPGGFSLGSHSMRSLSTGLNLSAMGAETSPRRARRWDDPDSESEEDEDEPLEGPSPLSVFFEGPAARNYAKTGHSHGGDGGFTNHSGYLQAMLARCSYFRTLTSEKPQPVDANWFHAQVYPAHYSPKIGRELLIERLTPDKVLGGYVNCSMFYHLAGCLSFEDDRVTSSRLAVMKAFYLQAPIYVASSISEDQWSSEEHLKGAPPFDIRHNILSAMEHSTYNRLGRCIESSGLSLRCELDANHIAKRGYLGCDDMSGLSRDAVLVGCSIGAVTGSADERPAFKTRDSDSSMLEMFKFVVACEIKELAVHLREESSGDKQNSGEKDTQRARILSGGNLLRIAVNVFLYMFRCYGHKLGNSSELVEQPDLLSSLLESLEGLLLWAHALSVSLHSLDPQITGTVGNEPFINTVCRLLLQSTFQHWGDRGNFGQNMASIRVTEILLVAYTPISRLVQPVSNGPKRALPSLTQETTITAESVARRSLLKVCRCLGSPHFKVAMQALSCLQNTSILRKYVLPTFRPADRYLFFDPALSSFRELITSETARPFPVLTGMMCLGFSADLREVVLNSLVEALRANRSHWHPAVQQSCSSALDTLLDRLQQMEDEADERADRGECQWQQVEEEECSGELNDDGDQEPFDFDGQDDYL